MVQRFAALTILVLNSLMVASCGFLPADGPRPIIVASQGSDATDENAPYRVVRLNQDNVQSLKELPEARLFSRFGNKAKSPTARIHVGDVVTISLWEAGSGSVPSSLPNALPPQMIGKDGLVRVPFADHIDATNLTTDELADKIQRALRGKFIDPQVIITAQQTATQSATVIGDVVASARIPLNDKGDRLLEVLAQAGGAKLPAHEVLVRLVRNSVSETVRLRDILENPAENIYIHPGDTLYLMKSAPSATVMGAVRGTTYLELEDPTATLSDLVAKAGGLSNTQADPSSVYVFRYEQASILQKFDLKGQANKNSPIIYRVDMGTPAGYFVAKSFPIKDKDLIYVATATGTDVSNFFNILRSGTAAFKGADTVIQQ